MFTGLKIPRDYNKKLEEKYKMKAFSVDTNVNVERLTEDLEKLSKESNKAERHIYFSLEEFEKNCYENGKESMMQEEQKNMNIYQMGVIICLVYIGFYTLFLIMKTLLELGDYIYMEKYQETDTEKSYT